MNIIRSTGLKAHPVRAYSTSPLAPDRTSYLARAKSILRPGHPNPIFDYLSPTPSHLLNTSLAGHIPPEAHYPPSFRRFLQPQPPGLTRAPVADAPLPLGHHLAYFGPQAFSSELMPDGTLAEHCPGAPFTRRMWAGGSVRFPTAGGGGRGDEAGAGLRLDGGLAVCVEKVVGDPVIKGAVEGEEKVFVELSRKYRRLSGAGERDVVRDVAEAEENPDIDERRTLVFMRRTGDEGAVKDKAQQRDGSRMKRLKDKNWVPTYSFSLTPDRKLLFQFSALTFNAHAIHLDPRYAQEVEGHKDLLVHGPLSLSLMLMAVRAQADKIKQEGGRNVAITELNYRNLAPLYVGEQLQVCVRMREGALAEEGHRPTWDVWVEGPDGGFAVKGTAEMQIIEQGP